MRKRRIYYAAAAGFLTFAMFLASGGAARAVDVSGQHMYRMYNPNTGEHFYTASPEERSSLSNTGWKYEGIGWGAPNAADSDVEPVYRVYNPNSGFHHYTVNQDEKDMLVAAGWKDEGTGWYSDKKQRVPVYRDYNSNNGQHNYSTSAAEHAALVGVGWHDEGIGWYAVSEGASDGDPSGGNPSGGNPNPTGGSPEPGSTEISSWKDSPFDLSKGDTNKDGWLTKAEAAALKDSVINEMKTVFETSGTNTWKGSDGSTVVYSGTKQTYTSKTGKKRTGTTTFKPREAGGGMIPGWVIMWCCGADDEGHELRNWTGDTYTVRDYDGVIALNADGYTYTRVN